jgi:hypothetical protein
MQPFPDESEYAGVMSHLEKDEIVRVRRHGRLAHPDWCRLSHSFPFPFSSSMQLTFEILMLEFPGSRHPRVYAVNPEISRRRFPNHPPLRDDQLIVFRGKPLTALCTYLSSDGVLERDERQLVHLLDYTSMYLAKHMLWMASNVIYSYSLTTNRLTITPNPGVLRTVGPVQVFEGTHALTATFYRTDAKFESPDEQMARWFSAGYSRMPSGTWIGKSAPHLPAEMYREVRARDECPCGTGLPYGKCCRPLHAPIFLAS